MKKNNVLLVSIVCLVVLSMISACTTQSTTKMPDDTKTAPAEQDKTPGALRTQPETVAKTGSTSVLTDLMAKSATLKYTVTYNVKSTVQSKTVEAVMTQYMDLPGRMRYDTTMQGVESRSYMQDSTFTVCSKLGSAWNCFEQTYTKPDTEKVREDVVANPTKYSITELPSRTIAGASAKCFQMVQTNVTGEYCYSSQGVPLYMKFSMDGSVVSEMTATTYSTTVADADFELPEGATTQNLNDVMKNLPTGTPSR